MLTQAATTSSVTAAANTVATASLFTGPLAPVITSSIVGGGIVLAAIIKRIRDKKFAKNRRDNSMRGWERVEALIAAMDAQQEEVRRGPQETSHDPNFVSFDGKEEDNQAVSATELQAELKKYNQNITKLLKQTKVDPKTKLNDSDMSRYMDSIDSEALLEDVMLELSEDREFKAEMLSEALISTTVAVDLKPKKQYQYDTKSKQEILVAPSFSARSAYAYGSVEYDRKELKNRKYNAPLILTITFKERFADGSFADNDLVAVIGVLGVITRVPSEEMSYILKSSAAGQTVKGILKPDGKKSNLVADLLSNTKLKKDLQNLPQSADIWHNLEKVARLSVVNALAGKQNNNVANAHLIFSQKEVDDVKADTGSDYLRDKKLYKSLMKRYSAFSIMVASDISERLYIFDDPDNISWDIVPYGAIRSKDTGDKLESTLMKLSRM